MQHLIAALALAPQDSPRQAPPASSPPAAPRPPQGSASDPLHAAAADTRQATGELREAAGPAIDRIKARGRPAPTPRLNRIPREE